MDYESEGDIARISKSNRLRLFSAKINLQLQSVHITSGNYTVEYQIYPKYCCEVLHISKVYSLLCSYQVIFTIGNYKS